jgi:membrane-associated phospholipid phosphatase
LLALAGTGAVAILTAAGHIHDAAALQGFTGLADPRLERLAKLVGHSVDLAPYAATAALAVAVAAWRGRPRVALAIAAIAVLAPATGELLKPLVGHFRGVQQIADHRIPSASWPSGHATAAMTLAACAVMSAPRRLRVLVAALGGALAVAVSYSILMLAWHLPSDVLGGFLVAAMWALLAIALLRAADARWPARDGRRAVARMGRALATPRLSGPRLPARAGVAAGLGAGSTAAVAGLLHFQRDAPAASATFYASALAIAALPVILSAVLAVASRR